MFPEFKHLSQRMDTGTLKGFPPLEAHKISSSPSTGPSSISLYLQLVAISGILFLDTSHHVTWNTNYINDLMQDLQLLQCVSNGVTAVCNRTLTLRWRHNELDGVSDHQSHDCLLNRLFGRRSKKKNQSSASLAFVRGIHRGPVNSPHKWPVTRKMFPLDDVIMIWNLPTSLCYHAWIYFLYDQDSVNK